VTATGTEFVQERTNPSATPVFGLLARKKRFGTADGLWASVSNAVRTVITEFGKTHAGYYLSNDHSDETPEPEVEPLRFGRPVMWPERLWHNRSESAGFSREHEIGRSREKAVYRTGLPK
jgi:hypothetical protein